MKTKTYIISNDIYDSSKIEAAISDFSDIWTIQYEKWFLYISFSEDSNEADEIFAEFMNYVLAL